MATFTVSLPEDKQRIIDREATRNQRSRAGQIRYIIDIWLSYYKKDEEKK